MEYSSTSKTKGPVGLLVALKDLCTPQADEALPKALGFAPLTHAEEAS